jgi:hypothetical protein
MLSDEETAKVSMVEDGTSLSPGDEYIDLEALGEGVHRAAGSVMPMARVLSRKSVQVGTWDKILAALPRAIVKPVESTRAP